MSISALSMVEAIDAAIQGRIIAGGVQDYSIGNRRVSSYPLIELIALRKYYDQLYRNETGAGGVIYANIAR